MTLMVDRKSESAYKRGMYKSVTRFLRRNRWRINILKEEPQRAYDDVECPLCSDVVSQMNLEIHLRKTHCRDICKKCGEIIIYLTVIHKCRK